MKLEEFFYRRPFVMRVLLAAALLVAGVSAFRYVTFQAARQAEAEVRERAQETLDVQSDSVLRYLEKYRYLPALIANRADIARTLYRGETISFEMALGLQRTARFAGAVDVALMRMDGSLVYSTNGFITPEMVASNELRAAPLQRRLGRASISGSDGRRAYGFSALVQEGGRPAGIALVAAPLESIEQAWALVGVPVFAVNRAGQIVASNLFFRGNDEAISRMLLERRKQNARAAPETARIEGYQVHHRLLPILDWDLHVLQPDWGIGAARRNAGTITVLGTALAGLVLLGLYSRGLDRYRQARRDRAGSLRLERRVRDRTRELRLANAELGKQVQERVLAETRLQQAQQDLVQAEKLAAIGQMSATLAHEYNQPMAAVRGYADNAVRFLERGQHDRVRENLERISGLVDRLAQLSRRLLAFARKPDHHVVPVDLAPIIAEAIQMVRERAERHDVTILTEGMTALPPVLADPVRLLPVFTNLIGNAIDACAVTRQASQQGNLVTISGAVEAGMVTVRILDTGSGIRDDHLSRIFDPFFTTKPVGEGLGLGLPIAYNSIRDFGGELIAANRQDGGAEFTVRLRPATDDGAKGSPSFRKDREAA